MKIAIIGTGISGMSAAWLLSQHHAVTVYEQDTRIGGHTNTVDVDTSGRQIPVDTGFIVYNESAYPNLSALFAHLDVPTQASDMSLSVSLGDGALEYAGTDLRGLFAQKSNLLRPRFWSMLIDLLRFYKTAPQDLAALETTNASLGDYLKSRGLGDAFINDHLLPMAGAIWSTAPGAMLDYPAAAFIRFQVNHGLLQITDRPQWRTVTGGSRSYVEKLTRTYADKIRIGTGAASLHRQHGSVEVMDINGERERFDHVVVATHADEALGLLHVPTPDERALLGAFRYSKNIAMLHSDPALMPKRRAAWASWNYRGAHHGVEQCTVTYWMNKLQNISSPGPLFVTLNPRIAPSPENFIQLEQYEHPVFDFAALEAQKRLWSLQGQRNTWYCGAYFGSGFHEDGLQAGLAVAEALGGVKRPWTVANESGRIYVGETPPMKAQTEANAA